MCACACMWTYVNMSVWGVYCVDVHVVGVHLVGVHVVVSACGQCACVYMVSMHVCGYACV